MKTKNSFGIHFFVKRSQERKDGRLPIYGRIFVNGEPKDFSLSRLVFEHQWSSELGRANPRTTIAKVLNPHLDTVATEVKECYEGFRKNNEHVTAQKVKMRYLGLEAGISTLNELVQYHRQEELIKLAPGTAKNYKATETYLARFLKEKFQADDINLSQVRYAFVLKFENYLRTCAPLRSGQPLSNNGVMKHMERFQKIIGLGKKFEWMEKNPCEQYELKYEEFDSDFLEDFELDLFKELNPEIPRISLSKDIFVFACYTGLSYNEVKNLRKKHIVIGIDGDWWINIRRQKSKTKEQIPVLEEAEAVLSKYKKFADKNPEALVLPTPTNVTLNRDVKVLAKMANIDKHLTFHVARHTFATTVTLLNDVPLETVSLMLGHKKLATTRTYARVKEKKISKDMGMLKQKLKQKQRENEELKAQQQELLQQSAAPLRIVR